MTSYTPDQAGMSEFLNSRMLRDVVVDSADKILARAIALSPVGSLTEGDEHPGLYISSWKIRDHKFGGIHNDRVEAIVYNDSIDAFWVEFGHYGREPYHVLRRAAGWMNRGE